MSSPLGNIAINIISDFLFVVVVSLLVWLFYQLKLARARKFFGIDRQALIQIFVSAHSDKDTVTKRVFTAKEYEVADELRDTLRRQFPELITSWARLFGVDVSVPEISIKGSPLDEQDASLPFGSLVLVGGPTRNTLTKICLRDGDPWVTFNDENEKKKFIERREGGKQEELDNSHRLAILQKLIVNGRTVIMGFGFGEVETSAVIRHLGYEWKTLVRKYQDKEFARLLLVDEQGQVRVEREYSDAQPHQRGNSGGTLSAHELPNLPVEERNRLMAEAAGEAEKDYRTDPDLTDFEAFGEHDLYDETP